MPFQLSRGQMKLLTGATLVAFLGGLACVVAAWVTLDWRWGITALAALILGLALYARRLAGQIQRRTNEVIDFYGSDGPDPLASVAPVIPEPRSEDEVVEAAEVDGAEVEGPPGRNTP